MKICQSSSLLLASLGSTLITPTINATPTGSPDLAALCPASETGKFKCVDQTHFVLCNGLYTVVQSMAAGVPCHDDDGTNIKQLFSTLLSFWTHRATTTSSYSSLVSLTSSHPTTTVASSSLSSPPPPPPSPSTDPNLDTVHGGTKTADMFDCAHELKNKVLGFNFDQMFYCTDQTHYTTCDVKQKTPIFAVAPGQACKQQKDQTYAIVQV